MRKFATEFFCGGLAGQVIDQLMLGHGESGRTRSQRSSSASHFLVVNASNLSPVATPPEPIAPNYPRPPTRIAAQIPK
ncbi:hypothetical protein AWC15_04980 [Mycobacterium lacus]|uniref:hypothetical protein n=1 Tax=Mycobacterium lacus TaxID=169765 RepID=UPI000A24F811|nr:hypothetical protein [Mycobacterium lacus]MCV7124926.1 hypothetical protein [Mycobacterium lacus]ORW03666.1 hypothetical protein AWC15_04980 [Mycobacterium lacus]